MMDNLGVFTQCFTCKVFLLAFLTAYACLLYNVANYNEMATFGLT